MQINEDIVIIRFSSDILLSQSIDIQPLYLINIQPSAHSIIYHQRRMQKDIQFLIILDRTAEGNDDTCQLTCVNLNANICSIDDIT